MGRLLDDWNDSYIYQIFLQLIFIPIIKKHFDKIVAKSQEDLRIRIAHVKHELRYKPENMNNKENNQPVILHIYNPIAFCVRMILDPKIGLGESFMQSDWDAEPSPKHLLTLMIRAKRKNGKKKVEEHGESFIVGKILSRIFYVIVWTVQKITFYLNYLQHCIRRNTVEGSATNIHKHYDLGNDMFQKFLDPTMTYSCAVFEQPFPEVKASNRGLLEEAQIRKYHHILEKMEIKSSDHVLEIGCGWGACAIAAVEKYNCRWTGLTISTEQFAMATQKVKERNLENKITIKLLDYRLEQGTYDKVVAIEMIEAVGHEFLPQFFSVINDRLKVNGLGFIQAIVCPDSYYERYRKSSDFIKKYIFPGGHMPSLNAIKESLPKEVLKITEIEQLGKNYAVTLDFWNLAWMEHQQEILRMKYPLEFHRKWQFYFALCSALFEYEHIGTVHIKMSKCIL